MESVQKEFVTIQGIRYCRTSYNGVSIISVERRTKNGLVWANLPEWKYGTMKNRIDAAIKAAR